MSETEPTPEVYEQPELTEELGGTALWELVESQEHRIWRRR